jgi:hypothetical protein
MVDDSLPLILPVGTKVVLAATGAVGVIVRSPVDLEHAYTVRGPEGVEWTARRGELAVLSQWQRGESVGSSGGAELRRFIIYRCVVGSRAFGLGDDGSDTDRRGIYLPPAEMQWSLAGVPEQIDFPETEECYWELQKFLTLALKANPNILECLWTPLVEEASPLAEELRGMRRVFLSKLVYQTYNGYVLSQFKKLQSDLRNKGEVKWKHVMHLLRLLLSGIAALEEGEIRVDVGEHRDRLMAIKRGEVPLGELEAWRLELHGRFDAAAQSTRLPDRPDYAAADALLIRARRRMAEP